MKIKKAEVLQIRPCVCGCSNVNFILADRNSKIFALAQVDATECEGIMKDMLAAVKEIYDRQRAGATVQ